MKKKMPKMERENKEKQIKPKDIKKEFKVFLLHLNKELKQFLTLGNVCRLLSAVLYFYVFARILILILGLITPLIYLFIAIMGLPEAAFTNKFVFMVIMFTMTMYFLINTMWRLAFRFFNGEFFNNF